MQNTLNSPATFTGLGLHSGQPVRMVVRPAPADHGIWFRRTDIADRNALIPARWDSVTPSRLCTVIENDAGVSVSTIEHIMAALAGFAVHNAMVDINYYLGLDEAGHLATDYEHVTTSTNAPLTGTSVVADGAWVMLSATLDAQAGVRANAVNATQDVQLAPTAGPSPGTASLLVVGGANRSNGMASGRFKGDVAVVRTYDRALTPQELVATCHAYSARFRILSCPK